MTLRSEIITRIPTNTAFFTSINTHLLSHCVLAWCVFMWPTATNRPSLSGATYHKAVFDCLRCILVLLPLKNIFDYFFKTTLFSPPFHLSPKDTSVSGVQTFLWFGFSKPMGHASLFFSHSGLLSGVFALTCVQLGLLYPHYWLQVMVWTQSSWPRRGVRYIIVQRGTSRDQTEAVHMLRSLTLFSH